METKKLRQKILDLAIRGKLVPQDTNDEPASVLLERIRAEKERLIAEGKIKRPKKSKSTSSESHYEKIERPFEIPNSWEWTTLGDIFSMQAGKNIQASELQGYSKDTPYPCYGGNGIRGYLPKYSHHGTFPIIGRQGALCGNIKVASGYFYATEHAVIVDYFAGTNVDLWTLFLECLNLNQYATATAQPGLSVAKIEEVPIPLPPINEQHRIVERISQWFSTIDYISKDLNDLRCGIEDAKSKILELAMSGKLVAQDPTDEPAADMLHRINPKAKIITDNPHYPKLSYPESWCLVSLEDINSYKSETVNPSNTPDRTFEVYSVPTFSTGHPEYLTGQEIGSTKQSIKKDDILLCKINPHLNRVWEVKKSSDLPQIASSEWIVIRVTWLHTPFLKLYLESPEFRKLLCSQVSGVGGSLTRAQPAVVKKYFIPIPPFEEQKRISRGIKEYWKIFNNIEAMLL